jgi:hypothetical protein
VHPHRSAAHHVGPCSVWVVNGALSIARCACVGILNVTAMRVAVVPILPPLVGRGGTHKPTGTALLALVQGWLLRVAATIAIEAATASASVVVPAVVVTTLLLLGGVVDIVGWRLLLSNGHAELLKPRQMCLDGG